MKKSMKKNFLSSVICNSDMYVAFERLRSRWGDGEDWQTEV